MRPDEGKGYTMSGTMETVKRNVLGTAMVFGVTRYDVNHVTRHPAHVLQFDRVTGLISEIPIFQLFTIYTSSFKSRR